MHLLLNQMWIKNGALADELTISLSTWVHSSSSVVFAAAGDLESREYRVMPCSDSLTISVGARKVFWTAHTPTAPRRVPTKLSIKRPALRTLNCCLRL